MAYEVNDDKLLGRTVKSTIDTIDNIYVIVGLVIGIEHLDLNKLGYSITGNSVLIKVFEGERSYCFYGRDIEKSNSIDEWKKHYKLPEELIIDKDQLYFWGNKVELVSQTKQDIEQLIKKLEL